MPRQRPNPLTKVVSCRLTEDERKNLDAQARDVGLCVSDVVRQRLGLPRSAELLSKENNG